ncbi:MAG: HD domain-containing protein [Oscillospiraceae bacterium]|nr:HD domain-containing protein [Oscillospiraceae bacterium]
MDYNKLIADMIPGDSVEGFYVLKNAWQKITAAGKPFLSAVIEDKSGAMEMKVWDYSGPISGADAGKVIKLRGDVSEYRGTVQMSANRIRLADGRDHYVVSSLLPVAPIDVDATYRYVEETIASISDLPYREVCEVMLEKKSEALRTIPAGKSVHHSFLGGLLMHTANMLRIADFLSGLYADVIDRSLLLAGTFLHDLAKDEEFTFSELGSVTDYSVKGQLIGHLVMGAEEIAETCRSLGVDEERSVLLQHMILSHHGEPEYGAAVRPLCAEAELLSYIDGIDSRMEIYSEATAGLSDGEFSAKVFALDKKVFRHSMT